MTNILLVIIMLLSITIALFIISLCTLGEVVFIHRMKKCKHLCSKCEYAKQCYGEETTYVDGITEDVSA